MHINTLSDGIFFPSRGIFERRAVTIGMNAVVFIE